MAVGVARIQGLDIRPADKLNIQFQLAENLLHVVWAVQVLR